MLSAPYLSEQLNVRIHSPGDPLLIFRVVPSDASHEDLNWPENLGYFLLNKWLILDLVCEVNSLRFLAVRRENVYPEGRDKITPSVETKPHQQQQNKEAKTQTPKFSIGLKKKKKKISYNLIQTLTRKVTEREGQLLSWSTLAHCGH